MIYINELVEKQFGLEPCFYLFKHLELLCCVMRTSHIGCLNGYVSVRRNSKLYNKNYDDLIEIDGERILSGAKLGLLNIEITNLDVYSTSIESVVNVHGGITFSSNNLHGSFAPDIFGKKLFWFGFDTAHSNDASVFIHQNLAFLYSKRDNIYRDFIFVKEQTKSLAEQLLLLNGLVK